ncbi:hypothetical protein LTR04_002820 [Oleoguttula sp. CCFEE 6159]|nr:hypothetical protein LTR04_002820 [Oleoguttula sp. CCFEE 6159]
MAEEIFGEAPSQRSRLYSPSQSISNTNGSQETLQLARATDAQIRRRRGNHYAQFTRKFSLGNGPPDWVSEYLIHKEGGKMLGTLVALAVARMRSLETFVWDMPTGILRDVWLALSSLGDRHDGQDCRLERIWIRWHDNSSQDSGGPIHPPPVPQSTIPPPPPPPPHATGLAHLPIPVPAHHNVPSALATDRVESPTFSVLPPLKSLSVLDIDELPYLDEMSILIGRSQDCLRELRVGIARQARQRDWVTAWEGHSIQQVETGTSRGARGTLNEKRLGGVLGVLVGHVYDMREDSSLADKTTKATAKTARTTPLEQPSNAEAAPPDPPVLPTATEIRAPDEHGGDLISFAATSGITGLPEFTPTQVPHADVPERQADNSDVVIHESLAPEPPPSVASIENPLSPTSLSEELPEASQSRSTPALRHPLGRVDIATTDTSPVEEDSPKPHARVSLEILELERVPLSVNVMLQAFDWTILTSLTLLDCQNHEVLWKTLRRAFSPQDGLSTNPSVSQQSGKRLSTSSKTSRLSHVSAPVYKLNIKKIHTNSVSPSLITFLKETLAPNSLETLFLQDSRSYSSPVTIDSIYRGPLRRHRTSLKKLMIDSSDKVAHGAPPASNSRWSRWMLNREILGFITSGKMTGLRELGVAMDYQHWASQSHLNIQHYFLQRLPQVPRIRSLYISHLADHVHGINVDPRELALQVVDIVALRPEVEICYIGIATKCFEILENKRPDYDLRREANSSPIPGPPGHHHVDMPSSEDEDDDDDPDDDDDDDNGGDGGLGMAGGEETDSDEDDDAQDGSEDEAYENEDHKNSPRLRLREILFYDDKVAIFKARHGRL